MTVDQGFREQLARLLDWEEAHVGLDAAIEDLPAAQRGIQPAGIGAFAGRSLISSPPSLVGA